MSIQPADQGSQIVYTIFRDTSAAKKYEIAETWDEIVERIKSPKEASEKSTLPLISMGVYGDVRTAKNALRHQGNLRSISGVEGDYDGEVVPMEDAAERLGLAGIKAVFYTSPSHTPERPRWRVIAPLSREYPPDVRPRMVARINGILGGILTGESFTTSQSFYIGKVQGRDYGAVPVEGDCIDTRPEFDAHAIMPAGKTTADGGTRDETTDDVLRSNIRSGASFHESLRSLSARLVGRGMGADDAVAVLTTLMQESAEAGTERWRLRLAEIPRLVESAVAKFADPRAPIAETEQPPDDDRFPPIEVLVEETQSARAPTGDVTPNRAGPLRMSVTELLGPIAPREYVLPGIPVGSFSLLSGALSAAKTTAELTLAVSRATGFDLLELTRGDEVIEPGPVIVLTYEDADDEIKRRIQEVVQSQAARMRQSGVSENEIQRFVALVARNLRRWTLTGDDSACIVIGTPNGPARNQGMLDEILLRIRETFAGDDIARGVLICLDPLRLALRGMSQSDDLGADCVVSALNWLAQQIPHSALFVLSHWTKNAATTAGGEVDPMTASYGTSGSALYSQHARSNFTLHRLSPDDAKKAGAIGQVTAEDARKRRVVRMTHGRDSGGESSETRDYLHASAGLLVPLTRKPQLAGDDLTLAVLLAAAPILRQAPASKKLLEQNEAVSNAAGDRKNVRTQLEIMSYLKLIEWVGPATGPKAGGFQLTELGAMAVSTGTLPKPATDPTPARMGGENA